MVDLTLDKMHSLMRTPTNIRNISVIAHVDHGKSTLSDCLLIHAKICSVDSGGSRALDTRADEQQRGITIKSTAISMHFTLRDSLLKCLNQPHEGNEFLINLIDSPGHVDFSSEVTAALRVTDGALVVVDCVDGICIQTETVLRQAIAERIQPALCLNKLDRALLELKEPKVDLYVKLRKRVEDFNAKLQMIAAAYENDEFIVESLSPEHNDVSFTSGLQQWGFTLRNFAKFYYKRFNLEDSPASEKRMCKMLWSHELYFTSDDPWDEKGTFKKSSSDPSKNVFVVFVLNPIYKVIELLEKKNFTELKEHLAKYGVSLDDIDLKASFKVMFQQIMRTWLPAATAVLEQVVLKLPSPLVSQKYRASLLYEGPADENMLAIKNTDRSDEAPLMMYVSKMVPYADNRFIAFGRVFSGKVQAGLKVRIQGPGYEPGSKADLYHRNIQRTVLMMGRTLKDIPDCPAGNIIGLIGIDSELKKTGTICTREAFNIKDMKFSVSPVVKYSVKPKNSADLPKLKEGLIKLSKSDPICVVNFNDNGECTVAGAGELHLEIALSDLKNYAATDIIIGEPSVSYLEGIKGETTDTKMSKSANKHNRIYMNCCPLEEEIIEAICDNKVVSNDPKERAQLFRDHLNINEDYVKKILFFGPDDKGPNIIVDETKGIAYLNEIKEYMRDGFREVTSRGPLIGENLKGVRFNLTDLALHADAIHRTGNQITAPVVAVCKGLVMNSNPILYEPLFQIEIAVTNEMVNRVTTVLTKRRGIVEEFNDENGLRTVVLGYLPVKEAFGFNQELMSETKGQASAVLTFSHYSVLPGDFDKPGSNTQITVEQIRKKRGFGELKLADAYFDRL